MQVKNGEISTFIEFLDDLKLKGKASLGRTKLKEVFVEHLKEFTNDQTAVIDEYDAWKDKEKGTFDNTDEELNQAMEVLLNDEVEIEFKSPFKNDLATALEEYDKELSGQDAEVYAKLYENLVEENE